MNSFICCNNTDIILITFFYNDICFFFVCVHSIQKKNDVFLQGEQLRGLFKLQVFHTFSCILVALLPVYHCDRPAVLHSVLDCKYTCISISSS